jgi:hypothetical protein
MVCPPFQQEQFISCDFPVMQQALEVRPTVRSVSGQITPPVVAPPVVLSTQEVRPSAKSAKGPAPANPNPKPAQTAALELRPIIKKVEED